MRHARPEALDALEGVLKDIRALPGLTERKRGIFYHKAQAFLHFHEDDAGLFADVKLGGEGYTRLRVSTAAERKAFVAKARKALV